MSEAANITAPPVQAPSSIAMIRTLAGISMISGVLLALVYSGTADIIKKNKEEAIQQAVFSVIPGAEKQVRFELQASGQLQAAEGDPTGLPQVFAGFDGAGQLVGVALETSAQGYGDIIRVLYGYSPAKEQIVGFKVLESKETPGLGDKIGMEDFLANFTAMDVQLDEAKTALVHPIEFVKAGTKTNSWQVDGISGATISSKALSKMLQEGTKEMLPIVNQQLDVFKESQ